MVIVLIQIQWNFLSLGICILLFSCFWKNATKDQVIFLTVGQDAVKGILLTHRWDKYSRIKAWRLADATPATSARRAGRENGKWRLLKNCHHGFRAFVQNVAWRSNSRFFRRQQDGQEKQIVRRKRNWICGCVPHVLAFGPLCAVLRRKAAHISISLR